MAINRRHFNAGLAALGLGMVLPKPAMAGAGLGYLTSARDKLSGSYLVVRLNATLDIEWELPLPARGHDVVQRPGADEGLVVARRPGTFASVFTLSSGDERKLLAPAPGRHFYGHGVYSADGRTLWMTENDYDAGRGVVGVYDAADGYVRVGEFSSGGVGPHELNMLPDGRTLAVANGGIRTHPDTGREKLNLETMQPSLAYIDARSGRILENVGFETVRQQKLSLRHFTVMPDGRIAIACQDQMEASDTALPLIFTHASDTGAPLRALGMPADICRRLHGYCGSVAFDTDARVLAVSSPRGGLIALWHVPDGDIAAARWIGAGELADGCGVDQAISGQGFAITSGDGTVAGLADAGTVQTPHRHAFHQWDNHMLALV